MKSKLYVRIFTIFLSVIMLCAVFVACTTSIVTPEPPDNNGGNSTGSPSGDQGGSDDKIDPAVKKNNTVARSIYSFDLMYSAPVRLDFNHEGSFLGVIALDVDLIPEDGGFSESRRKFVYDASGRLEQVMFLGTVFENFTFSSDGLTAEATGEIDNEGAKLKLAYNAEGKLVKEEYISDEESIEVPVYTWEYDEDGNILKETARGNTTIEYIKNGNDVKLKITQTYNGETMSDDTMYSISYDDNNNLTFIKNTPNRYEIKYTYNTSNKPVKAEAYRNGTVYSTSLIEYNEKGLPVRAESADMMNAKSIKMLEYDGEDNLIKLVEQSLRESGAKSSERTTEYTYNAKGSLEQHTKKDYSYDESGKFYSADENTYDADDDRIASVEITQMTVHGSDGYIGKYGWVRNYTYYDEDGNNVLSKKSEYYNDDKALTYYSVEEYKYNDGGNITERKRTDYDTENKVTAEFFNTYTYDASGQITLEVSDGKNYKNGKISYGDVTTKYYENGVQKKQVSKSYSFNESYEKTGYTESVTVYAADGYTTESYVSKQYDMNGVLVSETERINYQNDPDINYGYIYKTYENGVLTRVSEDVYMHNGDYRTTWEYYSNGAIWNTCVRYNKKVFTDPNNSDSYEHFAINEINTYYYEGTKTVSGVNEVEYEVIQGQNGYETRMVKQTVNDYNTNSSLNYREEMTYSYSGNTVTETKYTYDSNGNLTNTSINSWQN